LVFIRLLVGLIAGAAGQTAQAQAMREVVYLPADCRSLLPQSMRGSVQPWQRFVTMEHCDRIKRLMRLSAILPPEEQPRFYEGVVPANRLPSDFGTDVPVLRVVFPERTFFDTGGTVLRPEVDPVLSIVAESLRKEPPDASLFVAGHADARGARPLNERLSIERADALARAIFLQGVNFSSIWRVGFGSDMALVWGSTPYAWDRNRRVEFLFAAKPEAVATWLADQQLDGLCAARTAQDVADCKARLDLKRDYTAVEINKTAPIAVQQAPRVRAQVMASKPAPVAADPGHKTALIEVDPVGSRRIHIDPVARQVTPVHVNL
jgi:outer membrane protein OmpA-like peptidoglycan-associated protein